MIYLFAVLISYLLGSIPMGLILTKIAGKGDLRKVGSGNIGAVLHKIFAKGGNRFCVDVYHHRMD